MDTLASLRVLCMVAELKSFTDIRQMPGFVADEPGAWWWHGGPIERLAKTEMSMRPRRGL
jgi:hypothetical protein